MDVIEIERCKNWALWLGIAVLCTDRPAFTATKSLSDTVLNVAGSPVDPFAKQEGIKGTVLLFIAADCPISNKYMPEIKRLAGEFEPKGLRFLMVYTDPDIGPQRITEHLKAFDIKSAVVRDTKQTLAHRSRVSVTPEAALFSSAGELIYHGRIDDRFPALGSERAQPSEQTLRIVLKAFLSGHSTPKETKAVGCRLPTLP